MNREIKKTLKLRIRAFFRIILLPLFIGCASNTKAVKETEKLAVEASIPKAITQISAVEDTETSNVRVSGNQLLTYTSVKQASPLGVLLYFPETNVDNIDMNYRPESDLVASIKTSELTAKDQTTRIEILLKEDVSYEVIRENNDLIVSFKKPATAAQPFEKSEQSSVEMKDSAQGPTSVNQKISPIKADTSQASKSQANEKMPAWINRIDFSSEKEGKSIIIIGTTIPAKYDLKKIHEKKLLLHLYYSMLPDYRKRPLITTRFESAVDRIIPFQTSAMKDKSGFIIELRESVPYFVEQTDNLLFLHFEASSVSPKPIDKAKLPPWKKVITQTVTQTEPTELETPETKIIKTKTGTYTGEKIALNFFETDIKNVFRILMDVSGKNFAIDKDVSGKVTLSFDSPVPWDQVLELVLKMNRLGMVHEGNIVRIATLKTLKEEEEERQDMLAAAQKAKEQKKALAPLLTEYIPISYANAKDDVLPHIVPTKERGSVTVDARNNQIIITDIADKIKKAKEIVRKIDKVTPQVMIEARIVEATDTFTREIGTSWSISGTRTDGSLGGTLGFDMSATNPPTTSLGAIGIQFSRLIGNTFRVVDARLAASESEGTVKIISAPKILTLDNKPAKIKQGLAYPYNKLDADGNTTTEFKDIALELEVTPHITPDERVTMKIVIKNNEIGAVINNQISFTTKEAYTELLVDDGDTIVIGGIRKTRKDLGEEGLPYLRKMPVLGWLFKTEKNEDTLEELLIFITPRVVQLAQVNALD
ncbi:MAG: type IV pilus secretin PilQ [Deltaproteobacteria bacterium]|jgi:type IV pilus assembly protein PilQ|nr:type IV pilus secretin PilQ [Deltaproteobacteria bacterium]